MYRCRTLMYYMQMGLWELYKRAARISFMDIFYYIRIYDDNWLSFWLKNCSIHKVYKSSRKSTRHNGHSIFPLRLWVIAFEAFYSVVKQIQHTNGDLGRCLLFLLCTFVIVYALVIIRNKVINSICLKNLQLTNLQWCLFKQIVIFGEKKNTNDHFI